jgi:hypothetical protein
VSLHRESARDLEDLLVNGRYLDPDEIQGFLERQILHDLMSLVRWENGNYRFDPKSFWPHPPRVRLSMEGALIEASRRVDEQKRFMAVFRDPHELLGVRDLPDPDEPLTEEEKELFAIIDGQHTVAEVVEAAPLTEYEAYEAIHRMLEAQWIEVVGRRDPARLATPVLPAEEIRIAREVPWLAEIGVALAVITLLGGLQFAARGVSHLQSPPPLAEDVFARKSLEDVRRTLELYRRDRGSYPPRLATLVESDWLDAARLRVPGRVFRYRLQPAGDRYDLTLAEDH